MPKVIINTNLIKSYQDWEKAFNAHEKERLKANIKTIYYGHELKDPNKVHLIFEVPSIKLLQDFMEAHSDAIEKSGHKIDSTVFVPCTD